MGTATLKRTQVVSMTLAPGIEIQGVYTGTNRGDEFTPTEGSWVDPDSLEIIGRPDRVAQYLADQGIDATEWDEKPGARADFLADLAQDLRERFEDSD